MWAWKELQTNHNWPWLQGMVHRHPFWKLIFSPASLSTSFGAESLLGRHGEPGREGEQSSEVRQEVRPDLHRLVLAGQAHHPAHAAVAGGWDPQEERERRLRPRGAAEGSSADPQLPFGPMCPLQQQQLLSLYIRAQSAARLSLHSQQQWPHLFCLSPAGPAWQPRVRDVLSRL